MSNIRMITALSESQGDVMYLDDAIYSHSPYPQEALFFGEADDGLPVLLNMNDPFPQSFLILGDEQSGKTEFLKTIVRAARLMPIYVVGGKYPVNIHVLTNKPTEFFSVAVSDRITLTSVYADRAEEFLLAMASWCHFNRLKKIREYNIVLLDNLSVATGTLQCDAFRNLEWLIKFGAKCKTWVVATDSSPKYADLFKTKIYGRGFTDIDVATGEFIIKEGERSVKFNTDFE